MKQRIPNAPIQSISRDHGRMGEGLFGCESSESFVANQRAKAPARLFEDFVKLKIFMFVCKSELDEIILLIGVATSYFPRVPFNVR